jgi:NitT/TauT family transport system substrate-binding protein
MLTARHPIAAVAAGILALTALAGCAGTAEAPPSASSSSSGPVQADIVVGVGGQLSNADVYLAISEGFFDDESLTATTSTLTAGSDAVPLLLKGDLDFAAVDMATAINATQQNVGITTVATNIVGNPADIGYAGIMASSGSGIDRPKDLEGKKVQVNQLGGTAEVLTRAAVEADGGDASAVEFVEIAPPQAVAALAAGQVDAAVLSEPLVTVAKGQGFDYVFNPEQDTIPGLPAFVFVTTTAFAQQNPEVVAQFQAAILAANAFANANPDAIRETAKTSTTIDPAVLALVEGLPAFGEEPITGDQVQEFIDFLVGHGALDASAVPAGDAVVWAP